MFRARGLLLCVSRETDRQTELTETDRDRDRERQRDRDRETETERNRGIDRGVPYSGCEKAKGCM